MNAAALHDGLERYLALRGALGFAMRAEARLLRNFVGFVEARGLDGPIQVQVTIDWACSTAEHCGPGGQARRLSVARGFLVHLRAAEPDTQVPAAGLLPRAIRRTPHIYSDTEINALMAAARELGPRASLRPHTIATLIGLLRSTGLRANEAIGLSLGDVKLDHDPPLLCVRQTKFRKSRLVPLHRSVVDALHHYTEQRRHLGYDGLCDAFFVSDRGVPFKYHAVAWTFVCLARKVGIRGPAGEKGPTIHCLRHTFAVQRLLAWYQDGIDICARLPELSVYLGHVRPQETYWYLSATPELLRLASDRFETHVLAGGGS